MVVAQRIAIAERSARTTWAGGLATGRGSVTSGSEALDHLPVTWAARTHAVPAMTSPEELAAAAHSASFSMALALRLAVHDATPEGLEVTATVSLGDVGDRPTVVSSALKVLARVPGLEPGAFTSIVDEAAALCPISRLFAGATITVDAVLETP
jgi:osmotically inducible protein OsmC